ncbi:MAG: hypothetical protein U0793_22290 [Gemmataceae bacterium]
MTSGLGVGIVVCGQYFGWNLGLKDNGPVAMLIASLAVCLLFLAWVLALSELAVAMPRAVAPLDYGLRAAAQVAFLMGWSMFLGAFSAEWRPPWRPAGSTSLSCSPRMARRTSMSRSRSD